MGDKRRQSAIVSVVFGWGGLGVGEIRKIELVRMGEERRWLGNCINMFLDVVLGFWRVGRSHGQVFGQLDIF